MRSDTLIRGRETERERDEDEGEQRRKGDGWGRGRDLRGRAVTMCHLTRRQGKFRAPLKRGK